MRPTGTTLALFLIGFPLAVLPVLIAPELRVFWIAYIALVWAVVLFDGLATLSPRKLTVTADAPPMLMLGHRGTLDVSLEAAAPLLATRLELHLELDPLLEPQAPVRVEVPRHGRGAVSFDLVPVRRGATRIEHLWVRWTSPLGLVQRQLRVALDRALSVEPNVQAVRSAALEMFSAREFASGLKVERYLADGSEFDSLREYVPGLDSRSINWRATARHRQLICEDYRAERNHSVVLAVDTGRLMCESLGGLTKLDHGITSALVMAYMALHTGDRVGFFAFDAKVRTFAEPQGGLAAFPRLRRLTADLAYHATETNFTLGLAELSSRLRRRSLIVLVTDFVDTVTAELMLENVHRLTKRHLVLFLTLRDPALTAQRDAPVRRLSGLYESVVASDFVRERETVILRLRRMGVIVIDAAPDQITTRLLNQYVEIKRRERI